MKQLVTLSILFFAINAHAQNVGIGTTTPHASAALDISGTNKGLLIPRLTTTQRNALQNPAKGLLVYDSSRTNYWYYTGVGWKEVAGNSYTADSNLVIGQQTGTVNSYNMPISNSSYYDSSGILYDNGGPNGNYANSLNSELSISTFAEGKLATDIYVDSLALEPFYDSLIIKDENATHVFIGTQTGKVRLTGSVKIRFSSNAIVNAPGFKIRWQHIFAGSGKGIYDSTQLTGWYFNPTKLYMRGGNNFSNNWGPDSSGQYSFAFGEDIKAKGNYSIAFGVGAQAMDYASAAIGRGTRARGFASTAMGNVTLAMGSSTTAMGVATSANGDASTAMGENTIANGLSSLVIGRFNDPIFPISNFISSTSPLFIIGNGTESAKSNAMVVQYDGNVGIGTNSPSEKVDVNGNIKLSGTIINEAWQTPTLNAGWVNFGGSYASSAFYKDKEERVHLRGVVNGPLSSTIFTLPAGYRPSASGILIFNVNNGNSLGRIEIQPNGDVNFVVGTAPGTWVSLDGISFRAD